MNIYIYTPYMYIFYFKANRSEVEFYVESAVESFI